MSKNSKPRDTADEQPQPAPAPAEDNALPAADNAQPAADSAQPAGAQPQPSPMSTLEKIKKQVKEGDEAPSSALRLRDFLGGEFLATLVRKQAWLIILVVVITTVYVGVRYQCQQDAIDISQLEKSLVNAKFETLSSSSNLTRLSRQSNVMRMLRADSIPLRLGSQPPYIIEIEDN